MRDVLVYRQEGGYAYLCKINICMHILHVNVPVHTHTHTYMYMNAICVGIHVYVYMCSLVCLCIKFFGQKGDGFLFNVSLEKYSSSVLGSSARGRTRKEVSAGTFHSTEKA